MSSEQKMGTNMTDEHLIKLQKCVRKWFFTHAPSQLRDPMHSASNPNHTFNPFQLWTEYESLLSWIESHICAPDFLYYIDNGNNQCSDISASSFLFLMNEFTRKLDSMDNFDQQLLGNNLKLLSRVFYTCIHHHNNSELWDGYLEMLTILFRNHFPLRSGWHVSAIRHLKMLKDILAATGVFNIKDFQRDICIECHHILPRVLDRNDQHDLWISVYQQQFDKNCLRHGRKFTND